MALRFNVGDTSGDMVEYATHYLSGISPPPDAYAHSQRRYRLRSWPSTLSAIVSGVAQADSDVRINVSRFPSPLHNLGNTVTDNAGTHGPSKPLSAPLSRHQGP